MHGTKSFIDCSILSQRDRTKDPIFYLEKVEKIFTQMMPLDKQSFKDKTGRNHIRLECKDNQQFEAFIKKWSLYFDNLLDALPKSMKHPPTKSLPKEDAPSLKKEVYLVMKIQTNLTNLSNYLLNLANGIYSRLGLNIFYESVADGLITYIQEKSDFDTFLRPISNEKTVREYYQKLGIKSEDFLTQRGKILKNTAL